jgi:hypothetical protein
MNTMHLLEQINKLWPDKLNDEQAAALAATTAKLDIDHEQVTAVCRAVYAEPSGKTPLQVRLIERLKDAANPLRGVRVGTTDPADPFNWYRRALAGPNASNQAGNIDWKIEPVKAVAYYHAGICDKDAKTYGSVRPDTIRDAWTDMRRFFGADMADAWVRKYITAEVAEQWIGYFHHRGETAKQHRAATMRKVAAMNKAVNP